MANRDVTVRVSATVSDYVQGMEQAAQATDRAADSADRLGTASTNASTSASRSASGLSQVRQSASQAGDSMDRAGSQVSMFSTGLDSLGSSFSQGLSFSDGFSGAILGVGERVVEVRGHFSEFGSEMSRINGESRAFSGGLVAVGGGLSAVMTSVINTGIEYNTLQQVAGRAMETMTGSAEAAADQMDRLHEFADTSPFGRDTWIEAQQQLMAFGMEAERVVPTMEGVQNAVAAIGGGDQEIRRLVEILGQVEGQGRITGRELQRLGQMGINAADIIGQSMGVSGNEIREQITAGTLDASTAITALTDGMNTRFDGAAEGLRDTMTGALDRIRARVRDLGSVIATPLVDPSGGGFLVEAINQAADFGTLLLDVNPLILQVGGLALTAAGGVLALGGAWGLASVQIRAFASGSLAALVAMRNLAVGLFTTLGGLRTLATGIGIAAAAWAAWSVIQRVGGDVDDFTVSVAGMEQALVRLADGQRNATDSLVDFDRGWSLFGEKIEGLDGAMERLTDPSRNNRFREWGADLLGVANDMTVSREAVERFDEAMTNAFAAGQFDQVAAGFESVSATAEELGWTASDLRENFPMVTDAILDAANASNHTADAQDILAVATNAAALEALQAGEEWDVIADLLAQGEDATYNAASAFEEAAGSAQVFTDAYSGVADAVEEAVGHLGDLFDNLTAVGEMNMSAELATGAYAEATRDLNDTLDDEKTRLSDLKTALDEGEISQRRYDDSVKDSLVSLDLATEAGLDYVSGIHDLYNATYETAEGMAILGASQEELYDHLMSGVDGMVEFRMAAGESKSEAEDWVRTMLDIPDDVSIETYMDNQALLIAEETRRTINEVPDYIDILIDADDGQARDVIAAIMEGDWPTVVELIGDDDDARAVVEAFRDDDWDTILEIIGEDEEARSTLDHLVEGPYTADITFDGDDAPAQEDMDRFTSGPWSTDVLVDVDDDPAQEGMDRFTGTPWSTEVIIDGDDTPARADMDLFNNAPWRTTSTFDGDDDPARGTMNSFNATPWRTTSTFDGDDDPARGTMNAFNLTPWGTTTTFEGNDGPARTTMSNFTNTAWSTQVRVIASGISAARSAIQSGLSGITSRVTSLAGGFLPQFEHGGLVNSGLQGFSTGGRLPYTGRGTDQILGVDRYGNPTARVDDGEFVVREPMTKQHEPALWAINNNDIGGLKRYVAGLAHGGVAGGHRPREFAAPALASTRLNLDYGRLGAELAKHNRKGNEFNFHTYNPVSEPTSVTAEKMADILSVGGDPYDLGGN